MRVIILPSPEEIERANKTCLDFGIISTGSMDWDQSIASAPIQNTRTLATIADFGEFM